MSIRFLITSLLAATLFAFSAHAQLTSGISSPVIHAGKQAVGYRAAYDPDSNGFAQQVHYDHALNGSVLLRGAVQARKTDRSDVDFDFFQAELRWQITPDNAAWQQGLRLDLRVRDDNRPGLVAVHWMHQIQLSDTVRARFTVLASADVGDNARDGVYLQTRGDLGRRFEGGVDFGAEIYNSYGAVDDILPFDQERHLVGPFLSVPLTDTLKFRTSALFGLTDASPDTTFRIFLTRNF